MINILIPLAGKSQFFSEREFPFSKHLLEIGEKTMIEIVIENLNQLNQDKQFIFIVNSADCKKFHLDNVLYLLTDHKCKIIKIDNETKGAACSALMGIEYINNGLPLIIANPDQVFETDLNNAVNKLNESDAGVITFHSIHPRWSYVRINNNNEISETAEKRPISKNAIAGFYYFKKGSDFVEAAMKMIEKDANINGFYYIAPSLNEMILKGKKLSAYPVENDKYHTFYTPHKVEEYEKKLNLRKG